jgi:hypothetical protein
VDAAAAQTYVANADGEIVWSWRPDAGVKFAKMFAGDGDKKSRSPGRALCTRDRGCSAHPVFPAPSVFRRDRCQANLGRSAPREREVIFVSGLLFRSSLRGAKRRSNPLFLLRGASIASLRLHDGRMWRLQLHSRSSRPSQHATRHSEISLMETKRRGILDAFARGMTASWEYGIETKLNPAR